MRTQTNSAQVRPIKKTTSIFWQVITSGKAQAQKVGCTWKKKVLVQQEQIPQGNPSTHA